MRKHPRLLARLRIVLGVAVSLAAPGLARPGTFVVTIGGGGYTTFVDQTSGTNATTIHAGDTVQWNWAGGPHSVTSGTCQPGGGYYGDGCTPDGNWDAGVQSAPHSFSKTFDHEGNFPYYCQIHGSMMIGVVFVQAATGPAPASDFRFQPTGPVVGTTVHFTDTSTATPTSWSWDFGDGHVADVARPSHSYAAAGSYTVTLTATNAAGSNSSSKQVVVAAAGPTAPCRADAETLCLSSGRFQVTAQWEKPDSTNGFGKAIPLTDDSGYYYFFDPSNIEMVAKVLDACGVNGNQWVFAAGLTNVKVTVDVLDTATGVSERYVNPLNTAFTPIQDTAAFPTCP